VTGDRAGAGGDAPPGGPATAADPLERAARRWPRRTALDGPGGRRTWEALDGAASGLAALLRAAGAGPGGRVAFLLPRGEGAVALLHAVPRTGAAAAPLHAGWTGPELADYLARLSPSHLVCSGGTLGAAEAALPDGTALVRVGPGWPPAEGAEVVRPEEPGAGRVAGGRPADGGGPAEGRAPARARRPAQRGAPAEAPPLHTILSTSGTSGRPKAVGLTLAAHVACARATERRMLLGPADRWLASLSPAHVGGVALVIRSAWTGAALVLRERFDAGDLAALAAAGRVTHASLVPTMLRRLREVRGRRRAPLPLRGILLGGDAADPREILAALELDYPLFPTYGLSEAASQVATARPEEARLAPESVGRPLAGTEVRIGEGDEILVRGPTLMAGYVLGPGAHREPGPEAGGVLRGAGAPGTGGREPGLDAEGWLHTGDAGRLDGEGRLFVTGRLSRRLVSGGVTVDPARVERVLAAHPAVREAAVVGLPDPEWGERVTAAVVPSGPGRPAGEAADRLRRELEAHCRGRLAAPALPRAWILVADLPRNPNGKVDMEALRRLVAEPRT